MKTVARELTYGGHFALLAAIQLPGLGGYLSYPNASFIYVA